MINVMDSGHAAATRLLHQLNNHVSGVDEHATGQTVLTQIRAYSTVRRL
jgi:hypothetical protein